MSKIPTEIRWAFTHLLRQSSLNNKTVNLTDNILTHPSSYHYENFLFAHPYLHILDEAGKCQPSTSLTPKTCIQVLGPCVSLYEMLVSCFDSTWNTRWINQSESSFESGTARRQCVYATPKTVVIVACQTNHCCNFPWGKVTN